MDVIIAACMICGALLLALGVATLRTGWTLPWARGRVTRPRLYGWGALLMGLHPTVQGLFYFGIAPEVSWEARFFSTNLLLLTGLALLGISQIRLRRSETAD